MLDVAATAGLLAKGGFGHLEAFSTEVEHALPGHRSLFADLVLRDSHAEVPVLLVEVDRENEGVGTLVEKLASYRTWCELPAKGAAKAVFEASLRRPGARTYDLRLGRPSTWRNHVWEGGHVQAPLRSFGAVPRWMLREGWAPWGQGPVLPAAGPVVVWSIRASTSHRHQLHRHPGVVGGNFCGRVVTSVACGGSVECPSKLQ